MQSVWQEEYVLVYPQGREYGADAVELCGYAVGECDAVLGFEVLDGGEERERGNGFWDGC